MVIALVGGVNATSILLVGLAPLLWVLYAVWGTREAAWRAAAAAVARIGILGLGVSLWWMAGLWAEGAYGINVLKYTETLPTVSSTSLSSEVLRGLGYWYFYGQDKLGPWTAASLGYLQWTWLIGVSFPCPRSVSPPAWWPDGGTGSSRSPSSWWGWSWLSARTPSPTRPRSVR